MCKLNSQDELGSPVKNPQKVQTLSRLNPKRYYWLFIGYYIVVLFVRTTHGQGDPSNSSTTEETTESQEHDHGGHETHGGIQLFHADWMEVESIFLVTLWIFCASIAKIAFHMAPKIGHIFPESCLLIIVGIFIGVILFTTRVDLGANMLPTKTFFFFMLPPIILDAGYFMPSRLFFGNLGTILLFAVIGTLWNTFAIGMTLWGFNTANTFGLEMNALEIFLFSSLISAVDPVAVLAVFEEVHVNEILYIIVFGESLLNDAVSIVLYHSFSELTLLGPEKVTTGEIIKGVASFPIVALGGTLIGVIWGFLIGFATRFTYHGLIIEPIFVFIMAYLAFLSAELFHFSGVLALIFCGLTMKNYVQANIAPTSNTTVKYALKMLSSSSETIIFIFLGVSTVNDTNVWNWWFVVITILSCTIYRFIGVFFFTWIANMFRLNKLGFVDQIVMSYGGLRGAVSFALVLLIDDETIKDQNVRRMFVTTTIAVVYFTVFLQGATIKPLVEWLRVKRAHARELTMSERVHERVLQETVTATEALLGAVFGHNQIREKFNVLDATYIRPHLIRDYANRQELEFVEAYEYLVIQEATNDLQKKKVVPAAGAEFENEIKPIPEETEEGPDESMKELDQMTDLPKPKPSSPAIVLNIMDDTNIQELFTPARQKISSYNRHSLRFQDLEEETNPMYVDGNGGLLVPPVGAAVTRRNRQSAMLRPITSRQSSRISTLEHGLPHKRYSRMNLPNIEILPQRPLSRRIFGARPPSTMFSTPINHDLSNTEDPNSRSKSPVRNYVNSSKA